MQVECPGCGCRFNVSCGGPPINFKYNVDNIIDIIRDVSSVKQAAIKLMCSPDTIYRKLKPLGIDPKSITGRKYTRKQKENQ